MNELKAILRPAYDVVKRAERCVLPSQQGGEPITHLRRG